MYINSRGLSIIMWHEGLELKSYPDPGSDLHQACLRAGISPYGGGYHALPGWERIDGAPWTVGYGDTGPDVVPGLTITPEEAERRLSARLAREFERQVAHMVRADVTANQFSALVAFAYNIGTTALCQSTLLRLLNAGDVQGAADQFTRWVRVKGQVMPGLVRRRQAERALFLSPDGSNAEAV